jgi:hypothetical protein
MTDPTSPPSAAPAEPVENEDAAAAAPASVDPAPPRPVATAGRALRLVVTLHPGEAGQRALLALGADGCDPVFRSCAADGLLGALEAVSALLAEAEARWREQPRNPSSVRTGATGRRDRAVAAAPPSAGANAPTGQRPAFTAPHSPATPPARPAPTGHLPLFG